jgi:hypothetical protein
MKKLLFVLSFLVMTNPAIADSWTSSFSEEGSHQATCSSTSAVSGIQCTGRYCDNISLRCGGFLGQVDGTWATGYFSEENGGYQPCGGKGYVVGMSCNGSYCDNIKLYCKSFRNKTPKSCGWTNWISEENGGRLVFSSGKYAVAVKCSGRYCDNKKFYICK